MNEKKPHARIYSFKSYPPVEAVVRAGGAMSERSTTESFAPPRSCWADGPQRTVGDPQRGAGEREVGSTCRLAAGHAGRCVWTPDEEIAVEFSGEPPGWGEKADA